LRLKLEEFVTLLAITQNLAKKSNVYKSLALDDWKKEAGIPSGIPAN